jgi:hypothetical protein
MHDIVVKYKGRSWYPKTMVSKKLEAKRANLFSIGVSK